MKEIKRCPWTTTNELMIKYHDTEWGVPVHEDRKLFEFIVLDAFQAGLSWSIILNKRDAFRLHFENFEPEKIAGFNEEQILKLIAEPSIIRNKLKIRATIENAKQFLKIQKEFGSFNKYIWSFSDGKTIHNAWEELKQIPARTELSDLMSNDLKKRGFKFVGSTICYAFMQAAGIVNDHIVTCFRYNEIKKHTDA
ncbi:MAG TPA: DNA-3-methyladenine glycosylase I [Candidatus Kapabacteria bacterium]|mgnify:FL=1|nr:DNA-3-methyladenine glycosylase I [Candidatus Kapabacteria bacterium]HPO62147.1 DNA-3-methyladenine glycosylase I [Candidatus Kapabacteria bacterium]